MCSGSDAGGFAREGEGSCLLGFGSDHGPSEVARCLLVKADVDWRSVVIRLVWNSVGPGVQGIGLLVRVVSGRLVSRLSWPRVDPSSGTSGQSRQCRAERVALMRARAPDHGTDHAAPTAPAARVANGCRRMRPTQG